MSTTRSDVLTFSQKKGTICLNWLQRLEQYSDGRGADWDQGLRRPSRRWTSQTIRSWNNRRRRQRQVQPCPAASGYNARTRLSSSLLCDRRVRRRRQGERRHLRNRRGQVRV